MHRRTFLTACLLSLLASDALAATKKFVFKIKTKSGGIVGNIVIEAKDIDLVQTSAPFTFANLMMLEELGFCGTGEGGAFVEAGGIDYHGGLPFNTMGGYLAQGKTTESAQRIMDDAVTLHEAGAFGIVLEGLAEPVAAKITAEVPPLTIGIGASVACDGQILVTEDMLGLSGARVPKFVKRYENLEIEMRVAVERYADEVRSSKFPELQHCFAVKKD